MMNVVIAMEGLQRDSQAKWKHKRVITGSSSHPRLRRYRLSGRCPISLWVGSCSVSLSRPTRHLPLSTMHLLCRCNNSLRDSRFRLTRGRGTSLVLVSSVARKATMLGSVYRTGLHSMLCQLSSDQVDDHQEEGARKPL